MKVKSCGGKSNFSEPTTSLFTDGNGVKKTEED